MNIKDVQSNCRCKKNAQQVVERWWHIGATISPSVRQKVSDGKEV